MPNQLKISIIQGDIISGDVAGNLAYWEQELQTIPQDTQLVLFPEMMNTGFLVSPETLAEPMDGVTVQWLKKEAKCRNTAIYTSIAICENRKIYNRGFFVYPDGSCETYDKHHLFTPGGESEKLTRGTERKIVNYLGWKILLQICYDIRFPVFSYNAWNPSSGYDYDLMAVCACFPAARTHIWNTLLTARAIENQCFVVAANRTGGDSNDITYHGNSMFIDPLGTVLVNAGETSTVASTTLNKSDLNKIRERFCTGMDQG